MYADPSAAHEPASAGMRRSRVCSAAIVELRSPGLASSAAVSELGDRPTEDARPLEPRVTATAAVRNIAIAIASETAANRTVLLRRMDGVLGRRVHGMRSRAGRRAVRPPAGAVGRY